MKNQINKQHKNQRIVKKQTLLLAAALVATVASARNLSPDEALARASSFARTGSNPTLVYAGSAVKSTDAAVYVFNRGTDEGYLVLSAEDSATPVLGFADEGSFDPFRIPDNMRWWLKCYAEQVDWLAKHSSEARPVFSGNVKTAPADREAIAPLCKTKWDQDAPYYNLCPTINNRRCYTGCVATSISQVMKYHNYPEKGKGTVSVTVNNSNYSMSLASTTLEWDNMLNVYTSGQYTTTQGNAVATLMKAVGYAVKMSYGTSASGAFSFDIPSALVDNFTYDAGLDYYNRDFYNETEWDEMMYNNLRDCGPIVYGGDSNDGGHSFVCDGYLNGYYHINWGWGGMSDGFFLLTALDPDSQGIGGASSGFDYGQDAILGIRKPVAGSKKPMRMGIYGELTATVSGTRLTLNNAVNVSGNAFTGSIGVRLVNQSTKAETYVKSSLSISALQSMSYYPSWNVTLPSSLASGTYKVYPVYATTTSPTAASWENMSIMSGSAKYATLTKTGSSYSVSVEATKRFEVTDVKVETDVYVNMPFTLTFTITNPNSFPRMAEIAPSFNRLTARVGYGAGTVIDLDANETRTITYTSTLLPSTMGAANCNLYICEEESDEDGQVTAYAISSATVVSVKKSTNATLSVTAFNIENVNNVNAASVRGSYTLKCTGAYSAGVINLVMFDNSTNAQVQSISLPPYYINAGETKTFDFDVVFSEAVAGSKYKAVLFRGTTQASNVKTITVDGFVGIDDINAGTAEVIETEYYTLQGIRVPADRLTPGVYVVRTLDSEGRVNTAKVVVR